VQPGCSIASFKLEVADALALAASAGFKAVELDWPMVERQLFGPRDGAQTLRSLLRDHDLQLAAVHGGVVSASRVDQQRLQIQRFTALTRRIVEFGCRRLVLSPGSRTLENFNSLIAVLSRLADDAEPLGAKILLANRLDSRIEDRRDLLAVFLGSALQKVELCLDVLNFHLAVVDPSEVIREHRQRLALVRLSNATGPAPAVLDKGELDVPNLITLLKETGYDGPLLVDNLPAAGTEHLGRQLRQTREYLEGLLT